MLFCWVKITPGGITKRMIYTMSSKIKQGEVWLADVLFKGKRQTKQRPVVIVGNELALDVDVIVTPVTSQQLRNQFDVDRKSTRLNSSHVAISYAVFCL